MKKLFIEGIKNSLIFIRDFENCLTNKYSLENPYKETGNIIPMIGKVFFDNNIIEYRFHGSSCMIKKKDRCLDYGVTTLIAGNRINITPRNLFLFIKSYKELEISPKDRHMIFDELEKDGYVKKIENTIATYEILVNGLK